MSQMMKLLVNSFILEMILSLFLESNQYSEIRNVQKDA